MAILQAKTENGWVEGVMAGCQSVSIFKGIPFAAPPVGNLRWRAPQPAQDWNGVRPAKVFANAPMQEYLPKGNFHRREFYPVELPMGEDCLYLNIWTPAEEAGKKYPVAFWVFGGGFLRGYAHGQQYDGEALAQQGIVYVSANYRSNGFGFMQHPDLTAEDPVGAGNYGMLDLVAALQWVKRNIETFGGDPEQITVFGQSAGGTACQLLTCSEMTRGMIQRAILQSGGGLGDNPKVWPLPLRETESFGLDFFSYAGISSLEKAREIPAEELNRLLISFFKETKGKKRFKPCVDGYFLEGLPHELQRAGRNHDIDYMIGCTRDETPADPECKHPLSEEFREDMQRSFGKHADQLSARLNIQTEAEAEEFLRACRANYKKAAVYAFCQSRLLLNKRPAYGYVFDHVPPESDIGVFHSAEHMYVFKILERSWRPYIGEDYDISVRMNRYWGEFIKFGRPGGQESQKWEACTEETPMVMGFHNGGGMMPMEHNPMIDFLVEYYLSN